MIKMAAMPVYGKNLKKLLLQNQQTDDLETWFIALFMQVLLRLKNFDQKLTLTHFTPRSILVTYAFIWEQVVIIYFLETIAALCLKVA